MGLILNNALVSVRIGPEYTGAAPVFTGTGASFMGVARNLRYTDELDKTDVGVGARKRHRFHSAGATMSMEGVVRSGAASYSFKANGAAAPVGKWIEVTIKPKSNLTTPEVKVGVITKWEHNGQNDDAQIEQIEIDCDPDIDGTEDADEGE